MKDLQEKIKGIIKESTLGNYAQNDEWNDDLAQELAERLVVEEK